LSKIIVASPTLSAMADVSRDEGRQMSSRAGLAAARGEFVNRPRLSNVGSIDHYSLAEKM
jgi:hypothetical protein